ncbi:cell division cycle-associated protein 3 [Mantella aurantiaca]
MGAAESRGQVTPSRPIQNLHLSRVTDPRSPTAGIMRTPIEVGDTPRHTLTSEQDEEEAEEPSDISDPRSPTHGIVRTPLRPSLHDSLTLLVKQLSEVFVLEDSGIEGSPAADVEPPAASSEDQAASDEASAPASSVQETAEDTPDVIEAAAQAEPTPHLLQKQKPRSKSPHASGSKNVRQRSRKPLMSSVPGRSPLKILREDNSPSTTVQNRQVKKILQSEPPLSLRSLKISHNSWEMSHNKENAQYTHSES